MICATLAVATSAVATSAVATSELPILWPEQYSVVKSTLIQKTSPPIKIKNLQDIRSDHLAGIFYVAQKVSEGVPATAEVFSFVANSTRYQTERIFNSSSGAYEYDCIPEFNVSVVPPSRQAVPDTAQPGPALIFDGEPCFEYSTADKLWLVRQKDGLLVHTEKNVSESDRNWANYPSHEVGPPEIKLPHACFKQ